MMNSCTLGPKDNLSTSCCLAPSQRGRTLDISSLHLPATADAFSWFDEKKVANLCSHRQHPFSLMIRLQPIYN